MYAIRSYYDDDSATCQFALRGNRKIEGAQEKTSVDGTSRSQTLLTVRKLLFVADDVVDRLLDAGDLFSFVIRDFV